MLTAVITEKHLLRCIVYHKLTFTILLKDAFVSHLKITKINGFYFIIFQRQRHDSQMQKEWRKSVLDKIQKEKLG